MVKLYNKIFKYSVFFNLKQNRKSNTKENMCISINFLSFYYKFVLGLMNK